jgi:hypothetical protein
VLRVALVLALVGCQSDDVSRKLGARCDVTADCDQKCLTPSGDWPGGFCTTSCTADSECGDSERCIDEDGGVCVFACVANGDCTFLGSGYSCMQVADHGGMAMVCHGG